MRLPDTGRHAVRAPPGKRFESAALAGRGEPPHTPGPGRPNRPPSRTRSSLLHLTQTEDLRAALHVLAHLPAERLEVVGGAVGVHGGLVHIALHEDIGGRRLASFAVPAVERVERAARLAGPDP